MMTPIDGGPPPKARSMRFHPDTNNSDPISMCFRDSLANAVAKEFCSVPVPSEQRDILVTSFLADIYGVLGGSVPFSGRNGPIYVVLTLTNDNFQLADICRDNFDVRLVTDVTFFDEAQVDLLFHIVDTLDSRFVYLEWKQDSLVSAISTIALSVCRLLDGSVVVQSSAGGIRPRIAFSRMFSARQAITSGSTSWMQQYVAGVVPKHFANVHRSSS